MRVDHRISELRTCMKSKGIDFTVVMNPNHQYYLTGFKALIYSRPIVFYMDFERTGLIVPGLEEVHAKEEAMVDEVKVYYEHPEKAKIATSHLKWFESLLAELKTGSTIGIDCSYAPSDLVTFIQDKGFEVKDVGEYIVRMRYVKDEEEIQMMVEAGELVNLAVEESLKACRPGFTEMEMDAKGNAALFQETTRRHPSATLDLVVMSPSGLERSVMPHVFSTTRQLQEGDVVIHSRQVSLNGYRAELERTVILGEPTKEQKKAFQVAIDAQQKALESIRPGITAAEVDRIAREVIQKEGLGDYAVHRVGHGIGISAHEKPYLRFDNQLVLEEGMAFSIEPGLYIPGLGGYRHSDTVILTADGCKLITNYPRDMASLIFVEGKISS